MHSNDYPPEATDNKKSTNCEIGALIFLPKVGV